MTKDIPLVTYDTYSYLDAKQHAETLDASLHIPIVETEKRIANQSKYQTQDTQFWVGLEPQVLQTPYIEIRLMLSQLQVKPNETLIDLGAAYSRMAYVVGRHYPQSFCKTYEFVGERVEAAKDYLKEFSNVQIHQADITSNGFKMPVADYYFIYDFGSRRAIDKALNDLGEIAKDHKITVIGRGRASRDAIEKGQPWLSQVYSPEHFEGYSFYYSFLKDYKRF